MAMKARLAYLIGSRERVFVELDGKFYPLACATAFSVDDDFPGKVDFPLMHVSVADFIIKNEGDV